MTLARIAKVTAVLLVSGVALVPASSSPVAGTLRPLSDADQSKTKETGCTFSFDAANKTLVQAVGHDFTIRTSAGLKVCRITDAAFQKLGDGSSTTCGGYTLRFKRAGKVDANEASDSSSWTAILTIGQGKRTLQTIRGNAGTAC